MKYFLASIILILSISTVQAYPLTTIFNNVYGNFIGTVYYTGCMFDEVDVKAAEVWKEKSVRGGCLITEISGKMFDLRTRTWVLVKPYESSGTSYSQFEIMSNGCEYVIQRIIDKQEVD